MTCAVVVFPGSNCDQDAYHAVKDVLGQHAEMTLKGYPLAQLAHRGLRELLIEFRLAKQYYLKQFSFLRFEVGQKPQRLQAFQGHGLCFVEANHYLLSLSRNTQQSQGQRLEQVMLVRVFLNWRPEFIRQRKQQ